jgi:hypothetical protein
LTKAAGRGTATFEIKESPKIKIVECTSSSGRDESFPPECKLRKAMLKGWWRKNFAMAGRLRPVFQEKTSGKPSEEKLKEFYRDKGYMDFDLKKSSS